MKSIKVLTASDRAAWVVRDPEEYWAFARWEANQRANNRTASVHEWRQKLAAGKQKEESIHRSWWVRVMRQLMRWP